MTLPMMDMGTHARFDALCRLLQARGRGRNLRDMKDRYDLALMLVERSAHEQAEALASRLGLSLQDLELEGVLKVSED